MGGEWAGSGRGVGGEWAGRPRPYESEVHMNILVCIKQVPDMESRFKINSEGVWYDEADLAYRMNEYDEYAVEQAVRLKEQLGGEPVITVLSIGPDRVVEALKKALAMGCDRGVHVRDNHHYRKDPWQMASIIAAYAKDQGFDLIFTGMQSQDRGSAQVGVTVAELLGYACATTLVGFAFDNGVVTAKRELEGGTKGVVKLRLPALVTCQLGLNIPRYPTLPNIMKAKKKEILALPVADLLKEEGLVTTERMYPPAKKGGGIVLEGDVGDLADRLIGILKEKTAVLR
ncbi:electron transfer flavoprotein beta-subunit [Geotalea uraniireducens Rf4]|uniref:Electron transfer flavoprotein subunit beta n=2 Tax=Geotalea uraniireducens TaxID=351604 RepID=A5G5Z2_GEOUR|nr:electron transfer flavoprotein beta-subunit [Geotalea uraniireducens Rf4]